MPLIKRDDAPRASTTPPQPGLAELLADLGGTDPACRRVAARGLGDHPQSAGALCAAATRETQESVRESIFTALIRIGTTEAATGLVPLLQSEDVGLRNRAIEALKTMPNASGEVIADIFASSTDVRIFGVEILGALAHPESPSWLVQVIEADSDLNVCAAAVDALVECGDHTAIPPLLALLDRFPDEPFLAFSIHTAVARIASA